MEIRKCGFFFAVFMGNGKLLNSTRNNEFGAAFIEKIHWDDHQKSFYHESFLLFSGKVDVPQMYIIQQGSAAPQETRRADSNSYQRNMGSRYIKPNLFVFLLPLPSNPIFDPFLSLSPNLRNSPRGFFSTQRSYSRRGG